MLVLYESKCAISEYTPNAVVDAAHIVPYADAMDHDLANGLLLRADLHNLFDDGLLRIEPKKLIVELSKELTKTPYASLTGMPLRPRVDGSYPSIDALDQHYHSFLKR
jgi:predicted restriction endonuclease